MPVKIDIIKHQSESDGKSTCPHAVVLAPDDVTVYTFPCIPDYDRDKVKHIYNENETEIFTRTKICFGLLDVKSYFKLGFFMITNVLAISIV